MSALDDLLTDDDWSDITADLCVGGEDWTVARAGSGDGINAPVGTSAAAAITAAVYRARPPAIVVAQPGTPLPKAPWHMAIRSGSVQVGDVVSSQADATLRFRVVSLPDQAGEAIIVERVR